MHDRKLQEVESFLPRISVLFRLTDPQIILLFFRKPQIFFQGTFNHLNIILIILFKSVTYKDHICGFTPC